MTLNQQQRQEIVEAWYKYTDDDTKNLEGFSFVISDKDAKVIADWFLDRFDQELAKREEAESEAYKLGYNDGLDRSIGREVTRNGQEVDLSAPQDN